MAIEFATPASEAEPLKQSPLAALNASLGARLVPFAGYEMPVQYRGGIIAEHMQCRNAAALFDVSHMGQASLRGAAAARALEALVPSDITGLKPGRQRYSLLLNEAGGIRDDFMVAALAPDQLFLVVNASRKDGDFAWISENLPDEVSLERHDDRALVALQGPKAAEAFGRLSPEAASLGFMQTATLRIAGADVLVSRSGYTGEDGFEISVPRSAAEGFARTLLDQPEVAPAGLGARDCLRLEAGLCLYGNDIDELTTPIEAGLAWTIAKRRRTTLDFPGAEAIRDQMASGPARVRIGLRPEGRAPARAGVEIAAEDGTRAGIVTSGSFGPSVGAPIAMGYVRRDLAADGTPLFLLVRGQSLPARVASLPFVPHRYIR
ncbi:MAG TPA: glycine cleavage system aminomethyltransferase GcvT [Acetobacteraceae bacterium]|nr:glycine cleavage system aminomethyltransferase GcvT [Acetobacteraceae bacterium]